MCSNLVIKGNFLYLKMDIHEKPKANMTFNTENLNTFSEVGNKKKMPILTTSVEFLATAESEK